MQQPIKNRAALSRIGSPFPFPAYIVKSYSSQSPDKKADSRTKIQQAQQQEFLGLIKGLKLREVQLPQKMQRVEKVSRRQIIMDNNIDTLVDSDVKIRKTNFRTREKRSYPPKNQINVKVKISESKALAYFFRYQIMSLTSLLNRREDYLNSIKSKAKQLNMDPLKAEEIQQRLKKLLQSKGKDKGRVKFNHLTNQQLRCLKYKTKAQTTHSLNKKQSKAQYDDIVEEQEEASEAEQRQDKIKDLQTWKRQNGCGYNQKVFIVKGGYHQLRKSLIQKGWFENQDVWSPYFDLKWTTRICDINYFTLKNGQAVNHFNNNHHLTSKYGITRRLRTLTLGHNIDIDRFYPRCYDLGDQVDFENFVENFKFSFC